MAPNETARLDEIRSLIEGHIADFRVFKTKLMGDDEEEDAQGRLPRIEATQADHEQRIVRMERFTWIGVGGVLVFVCAGRLVEFIYHIFGIVRH